MRIGVVKTDHGITGGFELVLDRIIEGLEVDGHTVRRIDVDVQNLSSPVFGVDVSPAHWNEVPEFFRYLSIVERCSRVDTTGLDLLISTQPGSYAARHHRHLAIMYHHQRVFYDLAEVFVEAGFVDGDLHAECVAGVRRIDAELFAEVDGFLASSEEFERRLLRFNGYPSLGVFHAGIGFRADQPEPVPPEPSGDTVLCVSRHEFPKRTELFAQAAAIHGRPSVIIGAGGRMAWVSELARRWHDADLDPAIEEPGDTWLRQVPAEFQMKVDPVRSGNLRLAGHVPTDELRTAYSTARCVVTPALGEDYGLTAIEAMAHGRPVIVCSDGGGLVDFIEDGVNGLVVEPTAGAIADAVERLASDDDLAAELGRGALRRSRDYTWDRGWSEIRAAIRQIA